MGRRRKRGLTYDEIESPINGLWYFVARDTEPARLGNRQRKLVRQLPMIAWGLMRSRDSRKSAETKEAQYKMQLNEIYDKLPKNFVGMVFRLGTRSRMRLLRVPIYESRVVQPAQLLHWVNQPDSDVVTGVMLPIGQLVGDWRLFRDLQCWLSDKYGESIGQHLQVSVDMAKLKELEQERIQAHVETIRQQVIAGGGKFNRTDRLAAEAEAIVAVGIPGGVIEDKIKSYRFDVRPA